MEYFIVFFLSVVHVHNQKGHSTLKAVVLPLLMEKQFPISQSITIKTRTTKLHPHERTSQQEDPIAQHLPISERPTHPNSP